MAKKSGLPKVGKLFPLSQKDFNKNIGWNNYLNPLSQKVLDMRAGPSGTSSVGHDRERKANMAATNEQEARRAATQQAIFNARYPQGTGGAVPPWMPPQGFNPNLQLKGYDPFAMALTPR